MEKPRVAAGLGEPWISQCLGGPISKQTPALDSDGGCRGGHARETHDALRKIKNQEGRAST